MRSRGARRLFGGLVCGLLALWWFVGQASEQAALQRSQEAQPIAEIQDSRVNPAQEPANRSRAAVTPAAQQPPSERLPAALRIRRHLPRSGDGSMRGRVAHLPGSGRASERTAEGVETLRRQRNEVWADLQRRRNALRVEILTREFDLDPTLSRELARLFERQLHRRLGLLRKVSARALSRTAFRAGTEEQRRRSAAELSALLGLRRYLVYVKMEREKRFGLPQEHRKPLAK